MENFKKKPYLVSYFLIAFTLFSCSENAQTQIEKSLIGTWDIHGTLIGENGEGWLLPHNQANPDCEVDYNVFTEDYISKEVRYNKNCEANENIFNWRLEGNILTLTKDEREINGLIHSIGDDKMTIGVQIRPGSEERMYIVYKKR